MSNLTKREIVLEIYRKSGFPQNRSSIPCNRRSISCKRPWRTAAMSSCVISVRDKVQVRKQRIGRNPNKPEAEVVIPQRAVVKFKSGKILKQQLKKLDLAKLQTSG